MLLDDATLATRGGSALVLHFMRGPRMQFTRCGDDCVAAGDARWAGWFGDLVGTGPFNTGCFADCWNTTCDCRLACSWCGGGALATPAATTVAAAAFAAGDAGATATATAPLDDDDDAGARVEDDADTASSSPASLSRRTGGGGRRRRHARAAR